MLPTCCTTGLVATVVLRVGLWVRPFRLPGHATYLYPRAPTYPTTDGLRTPTHYPHFTLHYPAYSLAVALRFAVVRPVTDAHLPARYTTRHCYDLPRPTPRLPLPPHTHTTLPHCATYLPPSLPTLPHGLPAANGGLDSGTARHRHAAVYSAVYARYPAPWAAVCDVAVAARCTNMPLPPAATHFHTSFYAPGLRYTLPRTPLHTPLPTFAPAVTPPCPCLPSSTTHTHGCFTTPVYPRLGLHWTCCAG